MLTQKQAKKALEKQSYSHPLIKNLAQPVPQDQQKIVPTYQPIIPSHQNRTSSKIIRYSTRTPSKNSIFTVFASPFHPIIEDLPIVSPLQCGTCGCKVNPYSKIQNYSQLICNLCGATSQIATYSNQEYKDTFAYQYSINYPSDAKERRVCFVLEASQYSFQKKMHKGVISAIASLSEQDFEVCFMLFDAKYLYLIDQSSSSLTKISLSMQSQLEEWDDLPLSQQQLFVNISQFNEQTAQIIENIMYEAYYTKQTVLSQVSHLLNCYLPQECEVKYFITTLNHLSHTQQSTQSTTFLDTIFKERQNQPKSQGKKSMVCNTHKQKQLALNEKMQFFILTQNTTYQQAINLLGYNINKIYDPIEKYKLQQSIYYDLFENLQTKWLTNVELTVITSSCFQIMQPEYPSFDLYGKMQMVELPNNGRYKHYQLTLKQCSHNTMVPLKFKIKDATVCDKLFFQISYQALPSQGIVLNGELLKIYSQSQMGLQFMDDESLFNEHLRNSLVKWSGQNFKQLRERLESEYQALIRLFKSNYRYDSINFPKTMKHYFLYVFSLLHKLKQNLVNSHTIYKMLNFNLETYSKQLYLRGYRLEGDELRNIKSIKAVFDSYSVIFMENGEELFMIFKDASVIEIKDIFGYFDTIPSLANSNYELPQLTTNTKYRNAINLIRESNASHFLRLKIVDQESSFFECYIQPMLYDKGEHFDFLRKAWKNA